MKILSLVSLILPCVANASMVATVASQITLTAQPEPGTYTSPSYGGILTPYAGVDSASGPGPVNGSATLTNSANGRTSVATLSGATSTALPGAGPLTLGAQASLNVTNSVPGYYGAEAFSEFHDYLDITGLQTGRQYLFDFNFSLSGFTSSSSNTRSWAEVYFILSGSAGVADSYWTARYPGSTNASTADLTNNFHWIFQKFNPGETVAHLTIRVKAFTDSSPDGGSYVGPVGSDLISNADFLHTFVLNGATLRDANGTPIPNSNVVDVSGYSFSGPASVPEPSTVFTALAGCAVLVYLRAKKKAGLRDI